jgi:AAHS family 4-hydroxybenzoate transporter-like MFS transporter
LLDRQITDVSEIIEHQKLSRFIIQLIVVSWIVTFFDGFDMNVIAFVAPDLANALHLNKLMLGNLFSAGLAGTMIGGFLFGYLGDRFGRRPSIILATASFGVLTLGLALPVGYVALLWMRLVQGIAIGGMLPLCWALNIEYVPRTYRSTVVTLIMLGYSFGNGFAGPLTIWMTPHYGWRSVFVFGGCAALLATGLLIARLPESIRFLASQGKRSDGIAQFAGRLAPGHVIRATDQFVVSDEIGKANRSFTVSLLFEGELRRITPLLWIAYIASSIAVFFGVSWTPAVLQMLGFSRSTAALTASANAMGGALGGLLLMRFTDRRGASSIAAYPVLTVPMFLVMGLARLGGTQFIVLNFFSMMFLLGAHAGLHSVAGIFYPSAYRGNGAGWATSIAKIGSILGPMIGGVTLSSRLPVKATFAIMAICPLVVGVCMFIVGRLQSQTARTEQKQSWAQPVAAVAADASVSD